MGLRFEAEMESTFLNSDIVEQTKKTTPPRARVVYGEDERDNRIIEFVKLLEASESSETMKGLLLEILNSNKTEALKPFLKDRSTERVRRPKKQGPRRSSLTKRSDLPEINDGSSHRKSRTTALGALTKLNGVTQSLGSSLRRSRQSEGCLKKSQHGMQSPNQMKSPNQRSRLVSSSSLLQLRTSRRGEMSRRRMVAPNPNQDDMQPEKQNSNWDATPGGISMSRRGMSTGSFLRPDPLTSDGNSKNASWGTAISPTRGVEGLDKVRQNALLRKMSEKRLGLIPKKKNGSDHSKNGEKKSTKNGLSAKKRNGSDHSKSDETKSTAEMSDSVPKLNNSFAQFCPTGQVAYQESQVCLNDLVDDLKSYEDSISAFNLLANDDGSIANEENNPEKKGLRKYVKQQLGKKGMGKDTQSIPFESIKEEHASLSDDNKVRAGDLSR